MDNNNPLTAQISSNIAASEATKVEQSRATAEVQAMAVLATTKPRDTQKALNDLGIACSRKALAKKAFFSLPRGSKPVVGISIHLATEIARIWGNMNYGIKEVSRNDIKGETEMVAFAWDIESNTRSEQSFISKHQRDLKGGVLGELKSNRDIYENNANMGARRLRACILRSIPSWFIEEAEDLCRDTLKREYDGITPEQRADKVIKLFERFSITRDDLEELIGRKTIDWIDNDFVDLNSHYNGLKDGTISKKELLKKDEKDNAGAVTELLKQNSKEEDSSKNTVEEALQDLDNKKDEDENVKRIVLEFVETQDLAGLANYYKALTKQAQEEYKHIFSDAKTKIEKESNK